MEIDKGTSRRADEPAPGSGGEGGPQPDKRGGFTSPIEFRLDAASGVPTYLQLVQQVEHALRLGYLKPGDQLPRVRDVVASLAINPNTVLKAYRELDTKGLTAGRPGQAEPGRAARADHAAPLPARLAGHRRRGRAGRRRHRGAVHQCAAGLPGGRGGRPPGE